MDLLCVNVAPNIIILYLLSGWQCEAVLRYLDESIEPMMHTVSSTVWWWLEIVSYHKNGCEFGLAEYTTGCDIYNPVDGIREGRIEYILLLCICNENRREGRKWRKELWMESLESCIEDGGELKHLPSKIKLTTWGRCKGCLTYLVGWFRTFLGELDRNVEISVSSGSHLSFICYVLFHLNQQAELSICPYHNQMLRRLWLGQSCLDSHYQLCNVLS